ncbi:TIGR00270 family protein [Candidatus Woesearchaeota archaeon]|jgi:putative transcription factor|nr:TIGR00270 family protein [Candidatus Woesearchaeota archaeon]MBT5215552.1 TIGR00270 family protein [Candidatus Woesearchaeota archaeon]MBT6402118.1 TIGR00270 family protein [Candidatus Woesearchaeota archaeon]
MTCELCGLDSKLSDVVIEGTLMKVCKKCGGYGDVISIETKNYGSGKSIQKVPRKIFVEDSVNFVIEGAGKLVKDARENKGLKQAQFASMVGLKESLIHKLETSLMKPDLATAKKIERILDIKIVEGYGDPDSATQLNLNDEDLTVGDLIKFKKEK